MFILYQRGAVTINEVSMKWDALLSCKCEVPPNDSNLSVSISVQHSSVNSDLLKRSVVVCVWIYTGLSRFGLLFTQIMIYRFYWLSISIFLFIH